MHIEGLHDLYTSPKIRVFKKNKIGWVYGTCEKRGAFRILVVTPEEKETF
jgi:hypothetical protein